MKKTYYLPENLVFGKTFLSNCVAKEILNKNKTVLYQVAPNMLDNIISYKFGDDSLKNYYKNLLDVDLLIIDDLGTESINNIKFTELFNIINSRLLHTNNKITKTIISTNLDLKDIINYYDEKLFSRIVGEYNVCRFFGDDLRIKKNKH